MSQAPEAAAAARMRRTLGSLANERNIPITRSRHVVGVQRKGKREAAGTSAASVRRSPGLRRCARGASARSCGWTAAGMGAGVAAAAAAEQPRRPPQHQRWTPPPGLGPKPPQRRRGNSRAGGAPRRPRARRRRRRRRGPAARRRRRRPPQRRRTPRRRCRRKPPRPLPRTPARPVFCLRCCNTAR